MLQSTPKQPDFVHLSAHVKPCIKSFNYPRWLHAKLTYLKRWAVRARFREGGIQIKKSLYVGGKNKNGTSDAKCTGREVLRMYEKMVENGVRPDRLMLLAALKACTTLRDLRTGMKIHAYVNDIGDDADIAVANTLVHMYAKCGNMDRALRVFNNMPQNKLVPWNTIIFGYVDNGEGEVALQLFAHIQDVGFTPNTRSYVAALKACAVSAEKQSNKKVEYLERGISIHSQLAKNNHEVDIFIASILIDMYSKCGSVRHAHNVFEKMLSHDLVSWNAMIFGYAECIECDFAFQLFAHMQNEGIMPNDRTYVAVFKTCAVCASKEDGKQVNGKIMKIESLEKGIAIQSQLAKSSYKLDIFVVSTMVDMYAKCGCMELAHSTFDKMPYHDLVAWNAVIFGYAESGESVLALELFTQMQNEGFIPDARTYVAALKASGSLGALETGKKVHVQICTAGFQNESATAACLVGFYSKCGSMVDAKQVFDSMSRRNLVTWNSLLAGYAHQGDARHVFDLFERMQEEPVPVDGITFVSVLHACSHAGLINRGREYFWNMCLHFMIIPSIEHYACMVDLLSRANHLNDAVDVVKNMPFGPSSRIWKTVLGACRKWKNLAIGKVAFENILELDSNEDSSVYVLMESIYLACGRNVGKSIL